MVVAENKEKEELYLEMRDIFGRHQVTRYIYKNNHY